MFPTNRTNFKKVQNISPNRNKLKYLFCGDLDHKELNKFRRKKNIFRERYSFLKKETIVRGPKRPKHVIKERKNKMSGPTSGHNGI